MLAEPIVRLVYQRGAFTPGQTTVVAGALAAFSLGLVFNGWMLMLNRAFFSMQSNWLPTIVALSNLALNAVLDAAFYRVGVWGIPLATSLVNVAGALRSPTCCDRRLGRIGLGAILDSLVRVVLASGVAAGLAFLVWWGADDALGRSFAEPDASLLVALAVAGGAYLGSCRVLRVPEVDALLALVRRGWARA